MEKVLLGIHLYAAAFICMQRLCVYIYQLHLNVYN